jgi:hypothetical protein
MYFISAGWHFFATKGAEKLLTGCIVSVALGMFIATKTRSVWVALLVLSVLYVGFGRLFEKGVNE